MILPSTVFTAYKEGNAYPPEKVPEQAQPYFSTFFALI